MTKMNKISVEAFRIVMVKKYAIKPKNFSYNDLEKWNRVGLKPFNN